MEENKNLNNEITKFEETQESMADLMKNYETIGNLSVGKELEVQIIAENSDGFLADLGIKAEGIILKSDYEDEKIPAELKVGEKVKVKIMDLRGQPLLSRKEVVKKENWNKVSKLIEDGKHVRGTIIKSIKGGFIVDLNGINAFLPASQLENHFVKDKDIEKYIGKTYEFAADFDRTKKEVIVSRRKILEDEKNAQKKSILESLAEGQILDGTVSNFARLKGEKSRIFGAFINLGGIDGLLHVDEMAWYKVQNPEELLRIGQIVRVQVIKFDKEKEKVSLSLRSLMTNPWDSAGERFPVGLNVKGKVVSIIEYGAFIELEKGIDGFLHSSEYAWNDSEYTFKKEVKKGQELEVQIISSDIANKKIGLSVKKNLPNPWDDVFRLYAPGTKVKGIVQNLTPFGAFVKLPEGIEGLVHVSDFSWSKKINHPADVLKKGDEIDVMVLEVSPQKEQISLSIKHLEEDPYKKYKKGSIITGKVIRVTDFGYFIEIAQGIEALIKHSEASSIKSEDRDKNAQIFKEGDEVEAKIIKVEPKGRKIEASVKKLEIDRERDLVKKYANKDITPTLGELLTIDSEDEETE